MTQNQKRLEADSNDGEIDLLGLLISLWRGKYILIGVTVLAVLFAVFLVLRTAPRYQAQGLLQLETRAGALALPTEMQGLLMGGGLGRGGSPTEAEILIMKSRAVIRPAVEELGFQVFAAPRPLPVLSLVPKRLGLPDTGLGFLRPYQWGNERIAIGRLEVPEDWLGETMVLTSRGDWAYNLALPDGQSLEGRVGVALQVQGRGFALLVTELEGPAGREFLIGRMALNDAVEEILLDFNVTENQRLSNILRASYVADSPEEAARVLGVITRAYVQQNIRHSASEVQNSLDFIEGQLPVSEQAVTAAQQALNSYRQAQQTIDVDYETRILLEQATRIEADLNALLLHEEELRKRYTVNHPTYQTLLENRAALERQRDTIRQQTAGLPETQKEIFNLTRNLEVAQQVYVQLLNRAQELQVVRASAVGSVRIIDELSPDTAISPRAGRILALGLVLGLLSGTAIVLVRRFMQRGIRGSEEIERLGLPVFGTLNFATDAVNHRKNRGRLPIHALTKPDDLVVEGLRSLRTSLHFGILDAKTNTVLLTSAAPGAGKSFTAINLAVVAAQAGQKVCVIDADLRRGYLRRYLGAAKDKPGLADYLAGTKPLDEVLLPGPVEGMSVILTGRYPPNPSELLMRAEFPALLEQLNGRFDLILIDSPPALAVTDPVVIGRYSGARIIVTRHLETMTGEIEAVRRAFEAAGTNVTGAILNGYRHEQGSHYGGGQYNYNYRYSYKSVED